MLSYSTQYLWHAHTFLSYFGVPYTLVHDDCIVLQNRCMTGAGLGPCFTLAAGICSKRQTKKRYSSIFPERQFCRSPLILFFSCFFFWRQNDNFYRAAHGLNPALSMAYELYGLFFSYPFYYNKLSLRIRFQCLFRLTSFFCLLTLFILRIFPLV